MPPTPRLDRHHLQLASRRFFSTTFLLLGLPSAGSLVVLSLVLVSFGGQKVADGHQELSQQEHLVREENPEEDRQGGQDPSLMRPGFARLLT